MSTSPINMKHLLTGFAVGIALAAVAMIPPTPQLVPLCEYEADNGCYWSANTLGNGEGWSFYACDDGRVIALDSRPTLTEATEYCR